MSEDDEKPPASQAGGEAPLMSEAPPAGEEPAPIGEGRGGEEPAADGVYAGGLRLLGAFVTLPWLLLYGVSGVWAVALAARSASEGLKRLDAGYTRLVTPAQLAFVGALLLAAFAVMLATALLLLFHRRSTRVWAPLLLVAAALTSGAVWAGVRGGLHPLLWLFLFFGLTFATLVASVRVTQVTRARRRGRIGAQ